MSLIYDDYFISVTDKIISLIDENKDTLNILKVHFGKKLLLTEYTVCVQPISEDTIEMGVPIGYKDLIFSWVIWVTTKKISIEEGDKELMHLTAQVRKFLSQHKNIGDLDSDDDWVYISNFSKREFGMMAVGGDYMRTARMQFTAKKRIEIIEN